MVGKHYQKFKYLYEIISNDKIIKNIDDITCKLHGNRIDFILDLNRTITPKFENNLESTITEIDISEEDSYDITYNEDSDDRITITISEF